MNALRKFWQKLLAVVVKEKRPVEQFLFSQQSDPKNWSTGHCGAGSVVVRGAERCWFESFPDGSVDFVVYAKGKFFRTNAHGTPLDELAMRIEKQIEASLH